MGGLLRRDNSHSEGAPRKERCGSATVAAHYAAATITRKVPMSLTYSLFNWYVAAILFILRPLL
jgi:hypothetical protein